MTYRNVCLTLYKYNTTALEGLLQKPIYMGQPIWTYYIYQEEICPSTKKKHIQFYGELTIRRSKRQIQKDVGDPTCHIEARMGTQQQNIDYCSKTDSAILDSQTEWGTPKKQGKRNDLNYIRDMVKSGETIEHIVDSLDKVSYQAVKLAITLKTVYSVPRTEKPVVM